MVRMEIAYQGNLRCEATHTPSGSRLLTDAPVDNMGKGEAFSPTDLVATGLATCILTVIGIVAQRHQIDLTGTRATVTKEMIATPMRRIARLAVEITVPLPVAAEDRLRLENAAHTCPVHRSLNPDVDAPITFHWAQ